MHAFARCSGVSNKSCVGETVPVESTIYQSRRIGNAKMTATELITCGWRGPTYSGDQLDEPYALLQSAVTQTFG